MSLYYNWFYKHQPDIQILNDGEQQNSLALPYKRLPQAIRNQFPDSPEKNPNYALISIVIANTGLGVGFVRIKQMEILSDSSDDIHVSRYNRTTVTPRDIITYQTLLRNIPAITQDKPIRVSINVDSEWGGANVGKKLVLTHREKCTLKIDVHAGFYA